MHYQGFPMGQDSATFQDKGTEIHSLSRDKGTTGQAQNLATGRDFDSPGTSRWTKSLSILHFYGRNKNPTFLCAQLPFFCTDDYFQKKICHTVFLQ